MKRLFRLMLMLGSIHFSACDPNENAVVVVEYKQIANFPVYKLASDSNDSTGAGDGMFIMYKITKIKNTGSEAEKFEFDANRVSTITSDKISNDTVTAGNILLVAQNLTTIDVAAGKTENVDRCFIKRAQTSKPKSLLSAQVPVIHQAGPTQPVDMTNVAPDSSVSTVDIALPSTLSSLCSSN